ncbi:hypothetical protein B0T20DRAFT_476582 [Sordaria brevicollis]|uniref:Uncharacterized protein n=1 Tax=Sordaria brevicollis TaxID=83679 RepID=A0AAE0UE56_SORBR|nr:hypothetical protein B0T20DRAFT_476582 [Sordaria brevicollis]
MPSTTRCSDPARCQLSQEVANALERFSISHTCNFEQAKRLLVDQVHNPQAHLRSTILFIIIGKVLDTRSESIAAVLQEEIRKWESERGTSSRSRRSG